MLGQVEAIGGRVAVIAANGSSGQVERIVEASSTVGYDSLYM